LNCPHYFFISMERYFSFCLLIACVFCTCACTRNSSHSQTNTSSDSTQRTAQHDSHKESEEEHTITLTQEQVRVAGIMLGAIEERAISGSITAYGMLDVPPQNMLSVSPHIGGFVQSLQVLEGQFVRKGSVIAVLEHQDYITLQEEYIAAKSRVTFLEAEYKRQEELQKENINATKTYQQTMAEYHALRGRVAGLEQRLQLLGLRPESVLASSVKSTYTITSPIDGYVTKVLTHRGKYTSPQDILCEIVNTEHLHAELMIFEKDVVHVQVHQRVRVRLSNVAEEQNAEVYLIGREVTQDRMVRVHVHFRNEPKNLIPYTALTATIETDAQVSWVVPDQAIVSSAGKHYIAFAQTQNSPEQAPTVYTLLHIERGISTGGVTAITLANGKDFRNLIKGAQVVVRGAYSLISHAQSSGGEGHGH
jgi:membrane fusion protein, heavy metal efflux system